MSNSHYKEFEDITTMFNLLLLDQKIV